jgi:NADP-dependent 3-hydroxy acid dehydrogenase YdfG
VSTDNDIVRTAVITGASSGIGEATARALATDGHRVALLARRADRIKTIAAELGGGAIAITADVTNRDSLLAAAERVKSELGGADILINNAGVMLLAPFGAEQRDDYRQMVEVNLLGAITAPKCSLTSSETAAAIWSTSRPSRGAPPAPATRDTPPQNGALMASPKASARSCTPTSA